tara:strand:- start:325 stop:483 length:159 start_codon:yes stop_codon:yes gene_type:complete
VKKTQPPKDKERAKIDADIETYLRTGGKVTQVETGVSGSTWKPVGAAGRAKA